MVPHVQLSTNHIYIFFMLHVFSYTTVEGFLATRYIFLYMSFLDGVNHLIAFGANLLLLSHSP